MPDRPRKTACRARLRFWRDSERRRSTSCRPRPLRAQSPCQSHAQNWQRDPIATRAEAALKQRFHVGVFPSLVVNPDGKMLGVLPKVYDWPDYIARIAAMPRPGAPALVPVSGPRLRSSTPSARPRGGETLSVRRRGFRRRPSAPRRALETGAFARNWRKTDFLRWRRDGAAGGADDRSIRMSRPTLARRNGRGSGPGRMASPPPREKASRRSKRRAGASVIGRDYRATAKSRIMLSSRRRNGIFIPPALSSPPCSARGRPRRRRRSPGSRACSARACCVASRSWSRLMHEMALTQSLVELIEDEGRKQGFSHVRVVRLEIGALGSVEPEAMRFCFEAVARGAIVEGARLDIDVVPGRGLVSRLREVRADVRTFRSMSRVRAASCAGRGWRRHAREGIGGRVMCTVCGCGTSSVEGKPRVEAKDGHSHEGQHDHAHDHDHGHGHDHHTPTITGMAPPAKTPRP